MVWKKGNDPIAIDITLLKYAGSSDVGDRPVLCINDTIEDDGDNYTIEVENQYGTGTSTKKLVVIGGKIWYEGSSCGKNEIDGLCLKCSFFAKYSKLRQNFKKWKSW